VKNTKLYSHLHYIQLNAKRAEWTALSNAIIDLGDGATLTELAREAHMSMEQIKEELGSKVFSEFFEKHLISRGFDGTKLQDKVRQVNFVLVNELVKRIADKKSRRSMSDKEIQNMLVNLNQCVRLAAQTEEILAKNQGNKKMLHPEEIMRRMKGTSSGRRLLKVVGGGETKD